MSWSQLHVWQRKSMHLSKNMHTHCTDQFLYDCRSLPVDNHVSRDDALNTKTLHLHCTCIMHRFHMQCLLNPQGASQVLHSLATQVRKLGIQLMLMNSSLNTCLVSDTCQDGMVHPSHNYTAWTYTH